MTHPNDEVRARQKRRRDPTSTRDRLVRAALDLFTTHGYHATTTPQIAQRAAVAEGTIYRHFTSKSHLLNEVYRAASGLFVNAVREAPSDLPCRERLAGIAEKWCTIAQRDPTVVRMVFVSRLRHLLDEKSQKEFGRLRSELENVLALGKVAGQVRSGPVDVWTEVWLRIIILVLEHVADRVWSKDDSTTNKVIESAWDAITALDTTEKSEEPARL